MPDTGTLLKESARSVDHRRCARAAFQADAADDLVTSPPGGLLVGEQVRTSEVGCDQVGVAKPGAQVGQVAELGLVDAPIVVAVRAQRVDERVGEGVEVAVVVECRDDAEPQVPLGPAPSRDLLPRLGPEPLYALRRIGVHHGHSRGPVAVARSIASIVVSPAGVRW